MSTMSMLANSFHEGGWPMFPILILGILQVIAAGRYAAQPDARQLLLVRSLGLVTLSAGCLGTLLGMIHCLGSMDQVPVDLVVKITLLGLGESINNVALALLLVIAAGLLTAVGALRAADQLPADRK